MLSDLLDNLRGTTWVQALVIGAAAILGFLGFRRFQRKEAVEVAQGVYRALEQAIAEHEGRLAEHLSRLEKLRSDIAWSERRVQRLFDIMDELRTNPGAGRGGA